MIVVEDLVKAYGSRVAVDRVSFEVQAGEILGFLGPNGAGKTTTMRVLTCFLPATSGSAKIAGFDIFEDSLEVRKHIGYLPENVPLYTDMTVEGYLGYMGKLRNVPKLTLAQRIGDVMDACGLTPRRSDLIGKLSRGYRQRTGLAQALIHDPEVLILDEPTASLDPVQIREVREYVKSLKGNHTIVLSTHILPEVELVCDRVLMINRGRIVADDTPENLRSYASSGKQRLAVGVRGEAAKAAAMLKEVPGVTSVAQTESDEGVAFTVDTSKDVREDIAARLVAGGVGLLRLELSRRSLEDIFVELATEEAPATEEA